MQDYTSAAQNNSSYGTGSQHPISGDYPYYLPADGTVAAQSSSSGGYYINSPVINGDPAAAQHYPSSQHQMDSSGTGSGAELMSSITPYECYGQHHHLSPSVSQSQDHLEVKYQAAFVEALEGATNNTSMDTSSVESDPLLMQHQPQQQQHYGNYEINYGANEWTSMTTTSTNSSQYGYPTESFLPAGGHSDQAVGLNETDLPNYCFAACVFSSSDGSIVGSNAITPPTSTEPADVIMMTSSSGSFSPPVLSVGARHHHHFTESYDYPSALLADELQPTAL